MTAVEERMIPLVAPHITRTDHEFLANARPWATQEGMVLAYEAAFAQAIGAAGAVAVSSGTVALMLAFRVLGFRGHKIHVPTYGCEAFEHAACDMGGRLAYVDSSWDVKSAQMTQAPADVLVHSFGRPTLTEGNSAIIEDFTLSLGGAQWDPARGSRLGICSTHATKMISTGRGGVLFGDDLELLDHLRSFERYRLPPLAAALGLSQLAQLDVFVATRRLTAFYYTKAFAEAGIPCPDADCGSVFFRYLIATEDPAAKLETLAAQGIEAGRGVFPALHAPREASRYPGAEANLASLLSVPIHPAIRPPQVETITEAVIAACQSA